MTRTVPFSVAQDEAARFFAEGAAGAFAVEAIRFDIIGWGEFDFYADGTAEDLATGERS